MLLAEGITAEASVEDRIGELEAVARSRLEAASEGELPEIQAWRRAFSRMGLKPTQYRCASEALLRRFRKEGSLPRIHPLIDLCNAHSLASAIPVAAFDRARIAEHLEVRHARGDETYETFSGEIEIPPPGEVIFGDADGRAHARRWTNRQSAHSAVRETTSAVLVVAEALHETARADVDALATALEDDLTRLWSTTVTRAIPTASSPRVDLDVLR